jgi:hypothetical protein
MCGSWQALEQKAASAQLRLGQQAATPASMASELVWITYVVAAVVVFLFGAAACLVAFVRHRTHGPDTTEFFLTARKSVGTFRIAWSFYAAAMGSWTLFSPAQYAWNAGVPLCMHSFISLTPGRRVGL